MPAGELVTVPAPAPALVTVSVDCGAGENVAPTVTGTVPMVKVQAAVPEQGPVHPANTEADDAGAAFSVTGLPLLMALELVQVPEAAPEVIVQLTPPVPV